MTSTDVVNPNLFDEIGRSYGDEYAVEDLVIGLGLFALENGRRSEQITPSDAFTADRRCDFFGMAEVLP